MAFKMRGWRAFGQDSAKTPKVGTLGRVARFAMGRLPEQSMNEQYSPMPKAKMQDKKVPKVPTKPKKEALNDKKLRLEKEGKTNTKEYKDLIKVLEGPGGYGDEEWDKEQIMAFKMKGFSGFKKETRFEGPRNDDKPSGRTKIEELKNDLLEINKSIERHSDKPDIVAKLEKAKKEIEAAIKKQQ